MTADSFYQSNANVMESYIDSFVELIVYGFHKLCSSGEKYVKDDIHAKIKERKGNKAKLELEDYLRNDLVTSYLKKDKGLFNLDEFVITPGAPEIIENIEIGIVDIRLESSSLQGDSYFVVECKLLSHYSSRMNYYIDHGIQRFSSGQYYPDGNNHIAGMLGFMINPSPCSKQYSIEQVVKEMNSRLDTHPDIQTIGKILRNKALTDSTQYSHIYSSMHVRDKYLDNLTIIHILLDYRPLVN